MERGHMDKKIRMSSLSTAMTLTLIAVLFMASPTEAHTLCVKGGRNLEVALLPPEQLFHTEEDGYFYPGCPKMTKTLKVVNIGDIPFRPSQLAVILYGDKQLATGLMAEIEDVGTTECHRFYIGTLNDLQDGVSVSSDRAIPRGKSITLAIAVWMPETAGNEYQGLCMTADIAVTVYFPPRS